MYAANIWLLSPKAACQTVLAMNECHTANIFPSPKLRLAYALLLLLQQKFASS